MGADLYILPNYNALQARLQPQFEAAVKRRDAAKSTSARKEAQSEVERLFDEAHPPTAYFRDAYSSNCLLAQLSLSWWDIALKLTEGGHLPLNDVKWLLHEVRNRRISCQTSPTYEQQVTLEVMAQVAGGSVQVDQRVAYSADDVEWFVSRKQALITFLLTAIELGEPPVCSL
jgi:hypothetical protein